MTDAICEFNPQLAACEALGIALPNATQDADTFSVLLAATRVVATSEGEERRVRERLFAELIHELHYDLEHITPEQHWTALEGWSQTYQVDFKCQILELTFLRLVRETILAATPEELPPVVWQGTGSDPARWDIDDDAQARWSGLLLRMEQLDDDIFWWAVCLDQRGVEDQQSWDHGGNRPTAAEARLACEMFARGYVAGLRGPQRMVDR